jgi:sugar lactone lactonase YvrE
VPETAISLQTVSQVAPIATWESQIRTSKIAFSPDGQWLAITGADGISLYDAETFEMVRFIGAERQVDDLAFSPDGETIASGAFSFFGRVSLWRTSDGELDRVLESGRGSVGAVAFSPDGVLLASGVLDGTIYLWRVEDGVLLGALEGGNGSVSDLAFSSDGTTLASATSKGTVRLWSLTDGSLLNDQGVLGRDEGRVAFSSDHGILAAAGGGEVVSLWQGADGMPLRNLEHPDRVRCLAFSGSGDILATGADDGIVRFWRVSDGILMHAVEALVNELAFSRSDDVLVASSGDRTIRFWGVNPEAVVAMPSPTPTVAVPTPTGPLHLVTPEDGLPSGRIGDLWIDPQGVLWLVTEEGIYVHSDGEWGAVYEGLANRVLGSDGAGRIWATLNDGWRVGFLQDEEWTLYGPEAGWQPGYGNEPVIDRAGRVWMTTGEDVRYLDPESQVWTTLSAAEIGLGPMEDMFEPVRMLTDVAVDQAGNVWVASCIQDGIVYTGQGVRWFDGESWSGSEDTAGECIYAIEVDAAGPILMTGFDGMIRYDPASQTWSRVPLPTWERRQLVTSFALDEQGDPWVEFIRFGPAGPWHSSALYEWVDQGWVAVYDPGDFRPIIWDYATDGAVWICSNGVLYRAMEGAAEQVDAVGGLCFEIAVDGSDRVWVEVGFGRESLLWRLDAE